MMGKISSVLASILMLTSLFNVSSETASAACDAYYTNDDGPSDSNNSYSGTWIYDGSDVPAYGDNYHMHDNSSSTAYYAWEMSHVGCDSNYWTAKVWLDNLDFTNSDAVYYKDGGEMNHINQYAAPSGWSTIETVYLPSSTASYTMKVSAYARYGSSQNTGADAFRIYD